MLFPQLKAENFLNLYLTLHTKDLAFLKVVEYVQSRNFEAAIKLLSEFSPDKFEFFVFRWSKNATDPDQ